MNIEKISQGTTIVLKLTGWLGAQSASLLEEEFNTLDSTVSSLILDCTNLEYVSSAGLRQFIIIYKKMKGNMTLQNVSDEIMSIIRMTGLDKMIKSE